MDGARTSIRLTQVTDYSDRFSRGPKDRKGKNPIVEKRWGGEILYALIDVPGFHGFRARGKLPNGQFIRTCEVPFDGQSLQWFIDNAELKEDPDEWINSSLEL